MPTHPKFYKKRKLCQTLCCLLALVTGAAANLAIGIR